ncbi:sodium-dependent noradrenaline transporter-like [Antedon mediterranea]|uniref:sodium-dependent noradrenaline transporter-like n=1 Tax=Antedon mediterranea TaxID=105859 RepID=UPI003AF5B9F2
MESETSSVELTRMTNLYPDLPNKNETNGIVDPLEHEQPDVEDVERYPKINGQEESKYIDGFGVSEHEGHTDGVERETWGKKMDFLLSAIGFAVDLSNVWRFPYLCYRNGGGAFLIPYVIFLIFGGMPLLYMEMSIGQYHREGAISLWKICPLFEGVGWAVVLIAFYVAFYYNVIIGWSIFYLIASFSKDLPWIGCHHDWNTDMCYNGTDGYVNIGGDQVWINASTGDSSAREFWERKALQIHKSDGIEDLGGLNWQMVLCFGAALSIVYFTVWKGVKTSGKVVWVTATMPYIVLLVLLIRGVTLPGAKEGITYYVNPDFNRLKTAQVWVDAATQIFYSIGAGFGVHVAFSSYNPFHNNCYFDAMLTSSINCMTSFLSGFVIFAFLGYMSVKQQRPIEDVATDGPGLVFEVYPEAISTLPGSTAWSIIFYIMLITLGLDSSFGGFESIATGLIDAFPRRLKNKRKQLVLVMCCVVFLVGLANVSYGGLYVLTLMDSYVAGTSLLFAVCCEAIGISWFYGVYVLAPNIEEMIGSRPQLWWRFLWKFISPIFLFVIVICSIIYYEPITLEEYDYPKWADAIGWCMALSSMSLIPTFVVYSVVTADASTWKQRLALAISPRKEHAKIKSSGEVVRFKVKHWVTF